MGRMAAGFRAKELQPVPDRVAPGNGMFMRLPEEAPYMPADRTGHLRVPVEIPTPAGAADGPMTDPTALSPSAEVRAAP